MSALTLAGPAMTLVRGPQIGAALAVIVSALGSGRNPRRRVRQVLRGFVLMGIPLAIGAWSYASVGRAAAHTVSQETAAYRKELINQYLDIALQHPVTGWGHTGWPRVPGMPSIDNYYLLLSLMHGLPAVVLLAMILTVLIVRLLGNGFRAASVIPRGSSLSFALAGIFAGFAFSILTVYMGENVVPIFFTLAGLSEAYLCGGGDLNASVRQVPARQAGVTTQFACVIA